MAEFAKIIPFSFFFFLHPFRSVPNLRMVYSETHGIPRKEQCFPRNNENIPSLFRGIFPEQNFDGIPTMGGEGVVQHGTNL
jgi:hypothetical protein